MAEVYVAKTKGIGGFEKLVAIKVIHPRFSEDDHFIQMLVEEAKISVQLSHVNIAQTFDLGCIDDTYYIAMEYIEGADTYRVGKRALDKTGVLPVDICCYIGAEICHGLGYAHRKRDSDGQPMGIVHRDISPQNVLVSYAGEVKLVDFGIAKAALRTGQTEVGVIKGKYYYMSPEQAWGDPVDQRSDVFSAGLLLHELLTGEMVYQENNVPALLDQVRKAEIDGPRAKRDEVPEELDRVLLRAVAKEPQDRYQSAHALAQDLTEILYRRNPTFTAGRLADLMATLFPEAAKRDSIVEPPEQSEPKPLPPQPTNVEQALDAMSRDEFTPAVESSVIFDLDDLTDHTRNDILPFRRPGTDVERQTRRLDAALSSSGTSTSRTLSRDDEWDEETFLKDRSPWDESTLVDGEGEVMANAYRLIEAARRAPDADAGAMEGEATVASANPFVPPPPRRPAGAPAPVARARKPPSIPPPSRLPPRPPRPPAMRQGAAAPVLRDPPVAPDEESLSTLDLEPVPTAASAPPADLPAEKTTALGELTDAGHEPRAYTDAGPSHGGIRLGPEADRFFQTPGGTPSARPPSAPAPPSPPAAVPGPGFTPPAAADPFAPPPPRITGPNPAQLGKPQPIKWLALGGAVALVALMIVGALAWALSGPDPSSLEILSVPDGARVTVDGRPLDGVTPVHVEEIETGSTAHVEIRLDGYEPRSEEIPISPGENRRLIVLNRAQVSVHIETVPTGAQIWIDDVHRGNSPVDVSLRAGQAVQLRARVAGRPEVQRRIEADASQPQQTVNLTIPPPRN